MARMRARRSSSSRARCCWQFRCARVDANADDMDLLAPPARGDLHAIDQAQRRLLRRGMGFAEARCRVVIGERQQAHAALHGQRYQLRWREQAIRMMAVGMQVDECVHLAGIIRTR